MLTLAHVLGARPPGAAPAPFLTYYDDATGERTELSYTTTDNWVAKTANRLRDDDDVQPGDGVTVALEGWRRVVAAFAVWAVGAELGEGLVLDDLDVLAYGDAFTPYGPASTPPATPDRRRLMVVDADPVPYALAALAGGGSLVICRNADPAALARRAETERAVAAD